MSKLENLCNDLGIQKGIIDNEKYRHRVIPSEILWNSVDEINKITGENLILIGGTCLDPLFLGFRKMRRTSNDIDSITNEEGILRLNDLFKNDTNFYYNSLHEDIFLEYNSVPFSFVIDETHNWKIPKDLINTSISLNFMSKNLRTISPEYLTTLKIKRSNCNGRVYGKDKLDIANMLIAHHFNLNKKEIDLDKTAELVYEHVTTYYDRLIELIRPLRDVEGNLRKEERSFFNERYEEFNSILKKKYLV